MPFGIAGIATDCGVWNTRVTGELTTTRRATNHGSIDCACSEISACDKTHERAVAPDSWRTKKVQTNRLSDLVGK
jgi:hypothetical protein